MSGGYGHKLESSPSTCGVTLGEGYDSPKSLCSLICKMEVITLTSLASFSSRQEPPKRTDVTVKPLPTLGFTEIAAWVEPCWARDSDLEGMNEEP